MKSLKIFGLFILLVSLLAACNTQGKVLTEKDNGTQVHIAVGEQFSVVLESNPTTGYQWEVGEIDRMVLKQLSAEYDADTPQLAGSGGAEIFTFEAIGTGETSLTFIYRRSWEDAAPAETFSVQIVVK